MIDSIFFMLMTHNGYGYDLLREKLRRIFPDVTLKIAKIRGIQNGIPQQWIIADVGICNERLSEPFLFCWEFKIPVKIRLKMC